MMVSILEGTGKVKCLMCEQGFVYPATFTCTCGNIKTEEGEGKKTRLIDRSGEHKYVVYPAGFYLIEKNRVLVDMDDTLAPNEYPYYGNANWKLINWLLRLPEKYQIYVYTCRLNPMTVGGETEAKWHHEELKRWLIKRNLKRFKIWTETIKPYAGMLIDDNCYAPAVAIRAFKFFNPETKGVYPL
jgi:hypothetical protein